MSKGRFIIAAITMLVVVSLLAAGGYLVYRAGWSRGYAVSQLGEEGAAAPYAFPSVPHRGWGFGFVPLLFGTALLFMALGLISRMLRFWTWKTMGGPWGWRLHRHHGPGPYRGMHWRRHHGPMPAGCWDWEHSDEEPDPDAEDNAE